MRATKYRRCAVAHLCPLSGQCGRLRAPRELVDHRIWLGHVLSLDTRISPHFVDERVRHFEAVAMTADLVIVDEADGAQAVLDGKAVASLDLTGSESSYEHALNRDLFVPLSAGRTDMAASNIQQYGRAASDFRSLNHSLVGHLRRLRVRSGIETPLSRFEDTFVTGNNILTAIFSPADISLLEGQEQEAEERRFNAIRALWDGCIRAALMRRTDEDQDVDGYGFEPDRIAVDIARSREEVTDAATAIAAATRYWISEPLAARRDEYLEEIRGRMFGLVSPNGEIGRDDLVELFRFLVGATTVIMQFLALIPAQQAMIAEGVHREPLFQQGISEDLGRLVPEALIGRLSGIRFRYEDDGPRSRVRLQYVSFRGAPRTLMYRLGGLLRHEGRVRGPNVLLASATSYLEETLESLRQDDGLEASVSVAWMPASALAASPRAHVRLVGLNSSRWPRAISEDRLIPDHVILTSELDPLPVALADRRDFETVLATTGAQVVISRARRDSEGRLLGRSPLLAGLDNETYLRRNAVPAHAFSESDRLTARPGEFSGVPQAASALGCWYHWRQEAVTAHDGLVRADHPVLVEALGRVQSASSLKTLLRSPLGFVWQYAFGWNEPQSSDEPLVLDALQTGNLVHAVLDRTLHELEAVGGLAAAEPGAVSTAVAAAAAAVAAEWESRQPVPPHAIWERTLDDARRLSSAALTYGEARLLL